MGIWHVFFFSSASCVNQRIANGPLTADRRTRRVFSRRLGTGTFVGACSLRTHTQAAGLAAVGYAALLATPGCPFFSLFSPIPLEATLRVLRTLAKLDSAPSKGA